jgi:hypothetical protein
MLNARSPKNIKTSTFEKASKSSHFRSDNQRQISVELSHSCRYQKRLISLINFATFFEIIRFARCEYSKWICSVPFLSFLSGVLLYPDGGVDITGEGCWGNQRGVAISVPYIYTISQKLNHVFFVSCVTCNEWPVASVGTRLRRAWLLKLLWWENDFPGISLVFQWLRHHLYVSFYLEIVN